MIAGIPLGMITLPYWYSPMYFLFLRIRLTPPILNALPFFVYCPRPFSEAEISLMLSPLS